MVTGNFHKCLNPSFYRLTGIFSTVAPAAAHTLSLVLINN